MDHYLDIRLLPDPEFPIHQLMDALFAKLHRSLSQLGSDDIGISFPGTGSQTKGLGDCMRVHGTNMALQHLMAQSWLQGMRDHVSCLEILPIPETAGVQTVRRVQAKGASDLRRLRRRRMARTGCTEAEALQAIPDAAAEQLKLPFLTVRSSSSGQTFHIFVRQQAAAETVNGSFNAYGFSQTATLPRF
jgi:CRISPR-associated endonuclease Csy4